MTMLHFQNHFTILETVFPTFCYAFLHYAHILCIHSIAYCTAFGGFKPKVQHKGIQVKLTVKK